MVKDLVLVSADTALTYRVRVYELASPSEFKVGSLTVGSPEPLDVKSISLVVSYTNSELTFDCICKPLSIDDGASPYAGWPSSLAPTVVVTFKRTTEGVLFGVLYPRNSANLLTFLFSVAVDKRFSL